MKAVLQTIRILVVLLLAEAVRCQDGFSERDLLRLQQIAANESPIETITSYSSNIIQRDPSSQSLSSVSVQYHMTDDADKQEEFDRAGRGRTRKVYRIKNPFQQQIEDQERQQENQPAPQDSDNGASNQYAAMQYSLPPEEFLRQMRAENQYYQQQQQQQPQVSTPAPNMGYTATPQPQYQYSTISSSGYDNQSPQANQIPQLEPKISQQQDYRSMANSYQYSNANSYVDSVQSTPSPIPPYVSTSNNQYAGTPTSTYVSSSAPIYLSSPANVQFLSSSIANVPSGTPDYSNKLTSTIGSNSLLYDSQELNHKMKIDHYDNSANGMRYPSNIQQQFQNDFQSSTPFPSSTPYPDPVRDAWQNNVNANAIQKSMQEYPQFQKYSYYRNQQDSKPEQNSESYNGDTHRIGNMPAANNVYLNFVQPDYQMLSNLRSRTRDVEHETAQPEYYSHGEYGWKLNDKKPLVSQNGFASGSSNFPRYQSLNSQSDGVAVSQMSFHMDTGKQHGYEHISKSSPETTDPQEFAKAAAKAHENMKRQQYYTEYSQSFNNNPVPSSTPGYNYYNNNNEKQRNKQFSESSGSNHYIYSNGQSDLITASPYYYANSRENTLDDKPKQPFDHDKALKNIVPIDVSNVVPENQQKSSQNQDNNGRYNIFNYNKDQLDQNLKQNYKSITDAFYQDKNAVYSLNIKPRPDEISSSDGYKLLESGNQFYVKQPTQEPYYSQNSYSDNKRYSDSSSASYIPQQTTGFADSVHSSANIQQQGIQRPQSQGPTDIASILKLNDIPYRLTQNLPPETFRLNNGNYEPVGLPTPLPIRLNQNVGSHQLDVASSILNKLMLNKQPSVNLNRPEIDPGVLSTINGFKIANPYNVDLKLVAEMLKGKPVIDDSHLLGLREQYNKPSPLKLDLSQLQQLLLKNDNTASLTSLDGLGAYSSPYLDIYGSGRFPYQGVKYSRSQEEEETVIPIADASSNHPIGAVMEQDDPVVGREVASGGELTAQDEDSMSSANFAPERPKHGFSLGHRPDRHRHPNSLIPSRHSFPRKYPSNDMGEPYPLLKPPPPHSRSRSSLKSDKHSRRRRVKRPKVMRLMKSESVYNADGDDNSDVSFLLKPPPSIAEAKSDVVETEPSS